MSAEFESGFSVREDMWHDPEGKFTIGEYPESFAEARKLAGLEWDPIEREVFTRITLLAGFNAPKGSVLVGEVREGFQDWMVPAEESKAIVRSDTHAVLSVQRKDWPLLGFDAMDELAQGALDAADGQLKRETMGALRGGRDVWELLRLDEPIRVPGDDSLVLPYLAITNSFDVGALKAILTYVRIVCKNTWQLADMSEFQVSIRHIGDPTERIEQAKELLAAARDGSRIYGEVARELVNIPISPQQLQAFLDDFIPIPMNAADWTKDQRAEKQDMFRALHDRSITTDGIRGTAYGLMQTMGEWLDHMRAFKSRDTYLARTMLKPDPTKAVALRRITELVDRPDLLVLASGRN